MAAVEELIPLSLMQDGQLAIVEQVLGRADHVHRLEELGIRPGTPIEMLQRGVPCIIRLGQQKLCFRADDTTSVLVLPRTAT